MGSQMSGSLPPKGGDYEFSPEEQPFAPGSPYSPRHPALRRATYVALALLAGIGSTFPSALTTVNVGSISGSLGVYAVEASWLPAIYFAANASANLTLVKARAQFGIPAVTQTFLIASAASALLELLHPTLSTAVLARACNGMAAAGLVTLTVYYLLQVFPPKLRPLALVIGLGLPQLGTPLARLVPVELLASDRWFGMHLLELAVPLGLLAAAVAAPLPPSDRSRAFGPLDLVTIGLAVPAIFLICGILGLGRVVWWTDAPWLGWMLAATVPLFTLAWLVETSRARPLIQFGWLGTRDILRFAAVALLVRLALAEQTFGVVGLLTTGGLTNDQLRTLFAWVLVAMSAGIAAAALTLSERRVPWQVMTAALCIALGAWLDSGANNLTRPPQLYLSQALIGFGTTLFIGPALLFGVIRMLKRGPDYLVTIVVLFSLTQNVGALLGSAILGSYQTIQARAHAVALSADLSGADPAVANRLAAGAGSLAATLADPVQRAGQGAGLLGRAMTQEANILAFDDVFRAVALMALATAVYIAGLILVSTLRTRQAMGRPA
jgi:hypothetical protein